MDSIKVYLTLICCHPSPAETNPALKLQNLTFGLLFFATPFSITISSAAFFLKNFSINLENSLHALAQVGGFSCATYLMIVGYLQRWKTQRLFIEFRKIQNDCKFMGFSKRIHTEICNFHSDPSEFIEVANNRSALAVKYLLKYSIDWSWRFWYSLSRMEFVVLFHKIRSNRYQSFVLCTSISVSIMRYSIDKHSI